MNYVFLLLHIVYCILAIKLYFLAQLVFRHPSIFVLSRVLHILVNAEVGRSKAFHMIVSKNYMARATTGSLRLYMTLAAKKRVIALMVGFW